MNLPSRTSKLLALQKEAEEILNLRFRRIFQQHRALAFAHRKDNLFKEHWTPELAAAGYEFAGYEIKDGQIVLHGTENAESFSYRISISFPLSMADNTTAINAYFEKQYSQARSKVRITDNASADSLPAN